MKIQDWEIDETKLVAFRHFKDGQIGQIVVACTGWEKTFIYGDFGFSLDLYSADVKKLQGHFNKITD